MRYLCLILLLLPLSVNAKTLEKVYQKDWCTGISEYRLPDQTRVDCLTSTHAIEYDFAHKWAEAIGQALHYGSMTDRKPGIVLILESPGDLKFWIRLNSLIDYYRLPIDTWKIEGYQ